MGEHPPVWQDARFLVQHRPQQVVGVQHSLHQDVGLAIPYQCHGLAGSIVTVGSLLEKDVFPMAHQHRICLYLFAAANKHSLDEAHFKSLAHRHLCLTVGSPHYSHAFTVATETQMVYQFLKIPYCFHSHIIY